MIPRSDHKVAPSRPRSSTDGSDHKEAPSKDLYVSSVKDVPDAAAVATAAVSGMTISKEEGSRLVRKIDAWILPLLCITYTIQFLDKTSLAYASIMGIRTDNNLSLSEYSWLSSIFYVAFLVGEWPTNYALQRLPLAKWTSLNVIVWGGVLACTAATRDFKGLMVVRFFLGLFESCITPAFTLITSQWYLKSEQGTRTGIWFSCNALSQVLGSALAYGFAKTDLRGDFAIAAWKVLFIFLGTLTMAIGVLLFFLLPDSPLNARFLSEDERVMAIERIRSNNQGIGNKAWKSNQFKEALVDPLTWLYCVVALALNIPNGGFTNFFAILIQSFGFSRLDSLLYGAPGGAVVLVAVVAFLHLGDRFRRRILFGIIPGFIGLLGVLLIWLLPSQYRVGRLIGYYLSGVTSVAFVVTLSLLSSNVAGSTKKTTVTSLFFIAYCVGNLIGPQTFRDKDAPRYSPALITVTACICVALVALLAIWTLNVRENRRKQAILNEPGYVARENQEFLDLTDRENPAFVYTC